MFNTDRVFHDPIGWLKDCVAKNIFDMTVTLDTSHCSKGTLKAAARENVPDIEEADLVFQLLTEPLNAVALQKVKSNEVTAETFH